MVVALRRRGYSYNEILKIVRVAKSTLSVWLRKVRLSEKQKQRLSLKKIEAGKRGALVQREKRLRTIHQIKAEAKKEISKIKITKINLWLIGLMLYWAEGSKEKLDSKPTGIKFSNSDPSMIKLFVKWLVEICKVQKNHIIYELYIHDNSRNRLAIIKSYWAKNLGVSAGNIQRVYYKKNKVGSNRKNIGDQYKGLVRVIVRKSTFLNRKIAGWIEGLNNNIGGLCNGSTPLFGRGSSGSNPDPPANP